MGVVPENLQTSGGQYIKAEEFHKGLVLFVFSFEKVVASDPEYGAKKDDFLCEDGKLAIGETFRYTFTVTDKDNFKEERIFESKSAPFFIPFSNLGPDEGDKLWIKREGEGRKTKYIIETYANQDEEKEKDVKPSE